MVKARKSWQKTFGEKHHRRDGQPAGDVGLPRDQNKSFSGSNQENSTHSTKNVDEITKNSGGNQSVISQTPKRTARKSTGGFGKTSRKTITWDDVTASHSSEQSHDKPEEGRQLSEDENNAHIVEDDAIVGHRSELLCVNLPSVQTPSTENPFAHVKDLCEVENNSLPLSDQESVTENSNNGTKTMGKISKNKAGSQPVISQPPKRTARKSTGGLRKTNRKIIHGDDETVSQSSEHSCDNPKEGRGLSEDENNTHSAEDNVTVGHNSRPPRVNLQSVQTPNTKNPSAEVKDLSEGENNSLPLSNQKGVTGTENTNHGTKTVGKISKNKGGSQPVISQTLKRTARKSTGGLRQTNRKIIHGDDETVSQSSEHSCDNPKDLSEGENNSPLRDQENAAGTENSNPNTKNFVEKKKGKVIGRSGSSQTAKKEICKAVRGMNKSNLRTIAEDDVNRIDQYSENLCDYNDNLQTSDLEKASAKDKNLVEDKTDSSQGSSNEPKEFFSPFSPTEVRGRLLKIDEAQLNIEIAAMELEDDNAQHEIFDECSSDNVDGLQSGIQDINSDVEDDGGPAKKTTRPSIIRLNKDVPSSRKRLPERGHGHKRYGGNSDTYNTPKRYRGAKEKAKSGNESVSSRGTESVKRMSAELGEKAMAKAGKQRNIIGSDGKKKEPSRASRRLQQSVASKRKTVSSGSEDESITSNRQKDSLHDNSDSSSIVEPVRKKSAVPVQHKKTRRMRKSAIAAKKLLKNGKSISSSSENESVASNRQKNSLQDDSDSSSIVEPVRKKSALPVQHRKTRHVRKIAVAAKKLLKNGKAISSGSQNKSVASKRQKDSLHDNSDGSNIVEPVRKKSGIHSSEQNVCFVKLQRLPIEPNSKSVLLTSTFLKSISPGIHSGKQDVCFVQLLRLPIVANSKSVLLTSFLKSVSPVTRKDHSSKKRSVNKDREHDGSSSYSSSSSDSRSSGHRESNDVTSKDHSSKKKNVDEDWEHDVSSSSSSSSSDSRSSGHSESSDDSTLSSGSDLNYEPSEGGTDKDEVKSVSSSNSDSDFDYEVPSSEEETGELRFSTRARGKVRKKLRKRARKQGTVKLLESESNQSSSSSDDSTSSDETDASNNKNSKTPDDNEPQKDDEKISETDSHPDARCLSYLDAENSNPVDVENTEPDLSSVARRLIYSDDSSDEDVENVEPVGSTPKKRRYRPRKSISLSATQVSAKSHILQQGRGRSRMSSTGVSPRSRIDSDDYPSLNNSDVENMNSGPVMPSRMGSQRKGKSFGTQNVTSSTCNDDASRSIFNIHPCHVVCKRVNFNPCDVHLYGT